MKMREKLIGKPARPARWMVSENVLWVDFRPEYRGLASSGRPTDRPAPTAGNEPGAA